MSDNVKYSFNWEIDNEGDAIIRMKKYDNRYGDGSIVSIVNYFSGFLFDFRLIHALKRTKRKCDKLNKRYNKIKNHRKQYGTN